MRQRREILVVAATLGVVCLLYVVDLGRAPVYFGGDEVFFAVGANAIAETSRTLQGDFLPLMINIGDPLEPPPPWGATWYQPFLFYLIAAMLKVLPLGEATVRLPAALLGGLVAPALVYAFARRAIGSTPGALCAMLVLALSPTHLILSRQARDYIGPIAFVAAWLWMLSLWISAPRIRLAFAVGLVLGVGFFSHISAWLLMPMYLAVSLVVFARRSAAPIRMAAAALAGFALPLSVLVAWLAAHPEVLQDTVAVYQAGSNRPPVFDSPLSGAAKAATTFATFFNPLLLFVVGGANLTTSTGRAGVFLVPVALLLPVGLYALWQRRGRDDIPWVVIVGLFMAVIPAALRGEAGMIQRALCLIVFVAIIAGFGLDLLWRSRRPMLRMAAAGLAIVAVLQFGVFYRDFFTHYKLRSAFYYDPVAFADVASFLFEQPEAPAYYFDTELDTPAAKWRYYATKAGRTEVLARTRYVSRDAFPLAEAPGGSLCVIYVNRPTLDALTSTNAWDVVKTIRDVDNREAAQILRKRP
jgi:hypothetical protein